MGAGHHSIYIGDRDPDDMNQKLSDLYYLLSYPKIVFPPNIYNMKQNLNML